MVPWSHRPHRCRIVPSSRRSPVGRHIRSIERGLRFGARRFSFRGRGGVPRARPPAGVLRKRRHAELGKWCRRLCKRLPPLARNQAIRPVGTGFLWTKRPTVGRATDASSRPRGSSGVFSTGWKPIKRRRPLSRTACVFSSCSMRRAAPMNRDAGKTYPPTSKS